MALGIKKILIKAGKGALAAGAGIDLGSGKLPERLPEPLVEQLKEIITAGVAAGVIIASNGIDEDEEDQ